MQGLQLGNVLQRDHVIELCNACLQLGDQIGAAGDQLAAAAVFGEQLQSFLNIVWHMIFKIGFVIVCHAKSLLMM